MNPGSQAALQLRDIHLPTEPGFWPPAPGWWILAVLLLALLLWLIRLGLRRYRLRRQRQRILAMLDELEQDNDAITPEKIARISSLLRRLALMRYPRQRVAALTGADWLQFLDESGGNGRFSHGPGQVLASGPYQPTLSSELDIGALSVLLRDWIKKNTQH
ncbi:FIG00657500: hypothetical protein [hydrothermal vent metagenome]|uniref:DUF4381 domain-containing protein n=1 Tax=hydrothermal vent metagenome TaxID=652676 RepID=A0A3B1BLS0_9ZZZZ